MCVNPSEAIAAQKKLHPTSDGHSSDGRSSDGRLTDGQRPGSLTATSPLETDEAQTHDDEASRVTVRAQSGGGRRIEDEQGEIAIALRRDGARIEVEAAGQILRGDVERSAGRVRLTLGGEVYDFGVEPETLAGARTKTGGRGSGSVLAPMPGVVAEVKVSVGDCVEAGQVLVVLESMKLFTSLSAEVAGIVSEIACKPGETVPAGKRLALIEPSPAP